MTCRSLNAEAALLRRYRDAHASLRRASAERPEEYRAELGELEGLMAQVEAAALRSQSLLHNERNTAIITLTEQLVRALHGGRVTSCKSAKDRASMAVRELMRWPSSATASTPTRRPRSSTRWSRTALAEHAQERLEGDMRFRWINQRLLPEIHRAPKGTYRQGRYAHVMSVVNLSQPMATSGSSHLDVSRDALRTCEELGRIALMPKRAKPKPLVPHKPAATTKPSIGKPAATTKLAIAKPAVPKPTAAVRVPDDFETAERRVWDPAASSAAPRELLSGSLRREPLSVEISRGSGLRKLRLAFGERCRAAGVAPLVGAFERWHFGWLLAAADSSESLDPLLPQCAAPAADAELEAELRAAGVEAPAAAALVASLRADADAAAAARVGKNLRRRRANATATTASKCATEAPAFCTWSTRPPERRSS